MKVFDEILEPPSRRLFLATGLFNTGEEKFVEKRGLTLVTFC